MNNKYLNQKLFMKAIFKKINKADLLANIDTNINYKFLL